MTTDKLMTFIVIGGGQRGVVYARYALQHPDKCKLVAVADPRENRRKIFQRQYHLPDDMLFTDWAEVAALPKFADAVYITTLDQMHAPLVSAFSKLGYHILCEKPMATEISDCVNMVKEVQANNKDAIFGIGHVLRYSPYNVAVKEVIDSGVLGDIINIQHMEPIGNEHFSHSFVRGNWGKEGETSFSLMTKSCHDIDIVQYYYGGRKPLRITSFGSLSHFKPENKPAKAGDATRCLECPVVDECVWSAKKIYLDAFEPGSKRSKGWGAVAVGDSDVTKEQVTKALMTGPYGLCVYEAGSDVVDHQVVNIEYVDGSTASISMVAFTEAECARRTVIQGTKGELVGDMKNFTVFDFTTRQKKTIDPPPPQAGHGGGDYGLSTAFTDAVLEGDQSKLGVTPDDVLNSHLIVFAAEKARRSHNVVDFTDFKKEAEAGTATFR